MLTRDPIVARNPDPAYLQLLGTLVQTLVRRIVDLYKGYRDNELLFKEEIQQLQDNLTYYEQFKPRSIKYATLLQPLSNHLRVNVYKQYFAKDAICQLSETEYETQPQFKPSVRKRIYSSKNTMDLEGILHRHKANTLTASTSIHNEHSWKSCSNDKDKTMFNYLPGSDQLCSCYKPQTTKRQAKSLKSHNYHREVTKAYDKIIGTVINAKGFKRKRYQNKIQHLVRANDFTQ